MQTSREHHVDMRKTGRWGHPWGHADTTGTPWGHRKTEQGPLQCGVGDTLRHAVASGIQRHSHPCPQVRLPPGQGPDPLQAPWGLL